MKLKDFEERFNLSWDDIHKHGVNSESINPRGQRIKFCPVDYQVFRYHIVGGHSMEETCAEFDLHMYEILDLIADLVVRVRAEILKSKLTA